MGGRVGVGYIFTYWGEGEGTGPPPSPHTQIYSPLPPSPIRTYLYIYTSIHIYTIYVYIHIHIRIQYVQDIHMNTYICTYAFIHVRGVMGGRGESSLNLLIHLIFLKKSMLVLDMNWTSFGVSWFLLNIESSY